MTEPEVQALLAGLKTVAVLGAHPQTFRPAFYVPESLHGYGVKILPVNPRVEAGTRLWGEPVRQSLTEIDADVDIVDVFRRSEDVPTHLAEILAMPRKPRLVWLQSGIRSAEARRALEAAGIGFVEDRCLMVDYEATRFGV